MVKRVIIKTILICFGVFMILSTIVSAYIFKKYPLDIEEHVSVVVADQDIEEGSVIGEKDVTTKEVPLSFSNSSMATNTGQVIGKKAGSKMQRNDYITVHDLISRENWFKDDERIIILPMSIEERLANLIKKGSYVDIRLKKEASDIIETILYKVKVEDILDEKGTPLNSKTGTNSRTAYMKLVLDKNKKQKIYTARAAGRLIYELYCDETQKPVN